MSTTKSDISCWFDEGLKQSKDFMIIVCDTFDWSDYPVYCMESEFNISYNSHKTNMQKIMEVYDLSKDKDEQLSTKLVMNLPKGMK